MKPFASSLVPVAHVKAVRGFNRFYTQRIGMLTPYLGSEFSLTEVRVLHELAHQDQPTATELGRDLALDAGYLSRILRRFEAQGWVERRPSPADARQSLLRLTGAGYQVFAPLQQRSRDEAAALLTPLIAPARQELTHALATVRRLLAPATRVEPSVTLRNPQPGDMGWVVQQHGEVYASEYGWNSEFEALVAGIVAAYLRHYKPDWERCWIAELDGQRCGSAFVVRKSATVAQLRMLILTPQARGQGLGARLTDECIAFARGKGYKKMVLWTNSCLDSARTIYAKRGFQLIKSEPYTGFGQELIGETWALRL